MLILQLVSGVGREGFTILEQVFASSLNIYLDSYPTFFKSFSMGQGNTFLSNFKLLTATGSLGCRKPKLYFCQAQSKFQLQLD